MFNRYVMGVLRQDDSNLGEEAGASEEAGGGGFDLSGGGGGGVFEPPPEVPIEFGPIDIGGLPLGPPAIPEPPGGFVQPPEEGGVTTTVTDPFPGNVFNPGKVEYPAVSQPPKAPPTAPTIVASGGGGPVSVNVSVTNAETIGEEALSKVSDAVNKGLQESQANTNSAIQTLSDNIFQGIKNIASSIWDAVKGALAAIAEKIGSIVSGIAGQLKPILEAIGKWLEEALKKIADVVVNVVEKIGPVLDAITRQINKINDTLIQPIANVINGTIQTISTLTIAIEKDLHEGLKGILQIPTDISTGLSSLDATLQRTIEELGLKNKEIAESTIDYSGKHGFGMHLNDISDTLKVNTSHPQTTTFHESLIKLTDKCDVANANEILSKLNTTLEEANPIIKWIYNMLIDVAVTLSQTGGVLEAVNETALEHSRQLCPIKKLSPADALQARLRGFIDDATLKEELSKQGISDERIKVLYDLLKRVEDPGSLIDFRFRGIISDDDFDQGLKDLGWTSPQIEAFKQGSQYLPTTQDISRWRHFGLIDDATSLLMLKQLRYQDVHAQAYLETEQTRETAAGRASLDGWLESIKEGWLFNTANLPTPDEVKLAGEREGLHPETTRLAWLAHFNRPSYLTMLQSYFRGLRTLTEVHYVMQGENIPHELWDELIQVNRPLIPFRSIPAYVKAGLLSETDARSELAAHGFDLRHQNLIMSFVTKTGSKSTASTASSVHTLSLQNARLLFDDGALSEAQYISILEEHGFTPELAKAQAEIDTIAAHAKQRKQQIADLVAEVEAGVITQEEAISQLQSAGFTQVEIARFQASIRRSLAKNVKSPSIAELDKFIKAKLISVDQYRGELQRQGWINPWLEAFMGLVSPTPEQQATVPAGIP